MSKKKPTKSTLKQRMKADPLDAIQKYLYAARQHLEQYYGQCAMDDATIEDSGGLGLVKHSYHLRIGYANIDHARRQLMKYVMERAKRKGGE